MVLAPSNTIILVNQMSDNCNAFSDDHLKSFMTTLPTAWGIYP